jgi:hypothetical protein
VLLTFSVITIPLPIVQVSLPLYPRVLLLGVLYHQIVLPTHSTTFENFLALPALTPVQVSQQESHAVLVIYLQVDSGDVEVMMNYQATMLVGPAR